MTVSAAEVHELLRDRGATLATAESLTGGRLAALLTAVPGSSETYVGGVVSYATSVKIEVLGVPPERGRDVRRGVGRVRTRDGERVRGG